MRLVRLGMRLVRLREAENEAGEAGECGWRRLGNEGGGGWGMRVEEAGNEVGEAEGG